MRAYTKKVGKKPDFGDPVVLRCAAPALAAALCCAVLRASASARAAAAAAFAFACARPRPPSAAPALACSEDRGGTSIKHFCEMIHKSLLQEFQYALVWGTSSKHMPQRCAAAHSAHVAAAAVLGGRGAGCRRV